MTAWRVPVALAALALAGCTSTVDGAASAAAVSVGGTRVADYAAGQQHRTTSVDYAESPPVGGPHDPQWADCTGTVYAVVIRPENAVHSLEHGAVWVTYDPDVASAEDVATLTELVEGRSGLFLSPYPDQAAAVSVQAWNHQLRTASAADPRIGQFADLLTYNPETTPEPGATCENPGFAADPPTS
ncbi:DUF3105 domain-containing protein [Modestobacter sp. I12A-02628]|uniref:DUF3105 domain-containing protein n=1 Tax=Goekera deserti TaxID=2497753 RepID=A0A7K3WA40_9ACTN|nr:DUF3105 domain-containing protein [Goekera deserti]MPQ99179.1 DUF3105 domain-containing protein [Goekera deserti]NDI47514.1 DUF3105 domain-containing protein [Goekera deserti]NEL53325.1 DUF3105 domain-containing protein [Goekera deserti]